MNHFRKHFSTCLLATAAKIAGTGDQQVAVCGAVKAQAIGVDLIDRQHRPQKGDGGCTVAGDRCAPGQLPALARPAEQPFAQGHVCGIHKHRVGGDDHIGPVDPRDAALALR